jgi:iron complex outermembrane recepter protein
LQDGRGREIRKIELKAARKHNTASTHKLSPALIAGAILASASMPATCQQGTRGPQALDPLLITATREDIALSEAPASVTLISAGQIEQRRSSRIGDVLGEVPGLYLRNNAQGAHFPSSGQASISIRGVPRTTRTLVMIDGQPVNNALSGGIDLSSILLDNVRRIEVVRGPYSALYGGNAMGGVIHILTRTPVQQEFQGRIEGGFGDVDSSAASLVYRDRLESGLAWSLAVGYRNSSGWRDSDYLVKTPIAGAGTVAVSGALATTTTDNRTAAWLGYKGRRPWNQRNAEIKVVQETAAAGTITAGLAFAGYRVGYRAPETFLTGVNGQAISEGNLATTLSGSNRITLAGSDFYTLTPSSERDWRAFARWERNFANGMRIVANAGHMNHNFRFAQPGAGATFESGIGEWADQPNQRSDADTHLRWMADTDLWLTAGFAYNAQRLDRRTLAANNWRDFASSGAEKFRGMGRSRIEAIFAQAEYNPVDSVTVHAGARLDRFTTSGNVQQNTAPAFVTTYASRSAQQASPKLAVVWAADKQLTLRASVGDGFRPPTLLDLYSRTASPTTVAGVISINEPSPDLKAERIRAVELGFDWRSRYDTSFGGAVFAQRLSDLIYRSRKSATVTQSTNAGRARVEGIELSIRQPLFDKSVTLFATVSHLSRYELTENPALPASVGKKLTDVPGRMANAGIELARAAWTGSLVMRRVGHIFGSGDDLNANVIEGVFGSYDAHTVINAKVGYRINTKVSVAISLDNIANRQYFDFYKQPGMTGLAEMVVKF